MAEKRILIAYYSHSGNTRTVAQKIQNLTDGDLFEIKPVKQYPVNFNDLVNEAKIEKQENYKPDLFEKCDVKNYDVIFVGTPVWWYTFATPIRTFLSESDFSGKTIIPFCTHGGGGASETYSDIQKLCQSADVKAGFTSYENTAKDSEIEDWIKGINL